MISVMGIRHQNFNEGLVLRKILEGTASHTGEGFFRALVKNLAEALNTKGAWVTEFLPEKRSLRAISFWMKDHYVDEYEYAIQGTPCENVITEQRIFHVPENVIELFPDDPDLEPFKAVSYLGAPLLDLDGSILGHLAVQDTRPMPEEARNVALFKIFADRAASELRRLRAEKQLQQHEEQLSRLFDSAMDAIIELDTDLTVIQANHSAAELFENGVSKKMLNQSFERYVTPDSSIKLKNLLKGLRNRPEGSRTLWVPGGFKTVNHSGKEFQTEATLSCYEHNREVYFNLVLRNVSDRIEAEKRIDILSAQTEYLQEELQKIHQFDEMIGESEAMKKVLKQISQVAATDAAVLIYGETGTGKELVARSIHNCSTRRDKPMVKVNCAAIPASLIESEFFGHEQGAFTGATERRKGRFALADKGTIFLDEVGELPHELQSKLLRVLQEGEFEPVGSSQTLKADVRVISATNRDLKKMIEEGKFREDLYYRLHVFPIYNPPLRERGDDVILIAKAFLKQFSQQTGRITDTLSPANIHQLTSYHWPGNIRELRNIIERAVITSADGTLNLTDLMSTSTAYPQQNTINSSNPDKIYTSSQLEDFERQNMIRALKLSGWKVSGKAGAADLIGIPPTTFYSRMKALGIVRP
jgi:PAS domain S-box-containing protein